MVAVVSLSGCEEMFYREVDFSLEGEKEKLVVNNAYKVGMPFEVELSHTALANRAVSPNGDTTGVTGAEVSVRSNNGEWHRLHCPSEKSNRYYIADSVSYLVVNKLYFQPLDTIEMHITHPRYPSVSTRQILPGTVSGRIPAYAINGWVVMLLEIDPYHGNADDMIGIGIYTGSAYMANIADTTDRMALLMGLDYIYATNSAFAQAQNIQSEGYYAGSSSEFLFLPASALQDTLRIALVADGRSIDSRHKRSNYTPIALADLTLELRAYTHDSYLYESFRRNITGVRLPPPSGVPTNNGNIVQEVMDEIASALGGQEMIPPFTNIEGGLGCFRAYSSTLIAAPRKRVPPCRLSATP